MRRLLSALCSTTLSVRSVPANIPSFFCQRHKRISAAMTLVELLIVVAMVGTLAAIGVPAYNNYIDKTKSSHATEDIHFIEAAIKMYRTEHGAFPETLDLVRSANLSDPWSNPYQYLKIQGKDKNEIKGKWRKDHFNVPVNSDFDLYSMGKDGKSKSPFTAHDSRDDIVRANDGLYVGLVSDY
jgi:general secretion pathway protein G